MLSWICISVQLIVLVFSHFFIHFS